MAKQNKLNQIKKLIDTAHVSLENARQLLSQMVGKEVATGDVSEKAQEVGKVSVDGEETIIEGIFDGQNMVGPDGKQYSIPANYASKSKLVVGDTLKLTIMPDGSFLYKQIGPVERARLVGLLAKDETSDGYRVLVGNTSYKVLLASITYFKGEPGDEVVILAPKGQESEWAAVENIIRASVKEGTEPPPPAGVKSAAAAKAAGQIEDIEEVQS